MEETDFRLMTVHVLKHHKQLQQRSGFSKYLFSRLQLSSYKIMKQFFHVILKQDNRRTKINARYYSRKSVVDKNSSTVSMHDVSCKVFITVMLYWVRNTFILHAFDSPTILLLAPLLGLSTVPASLLSRESCFFLLRLKK